MFQSSLKFTNSIQNIVTVNNNLENITLMGSLMQDLIK